MTSRGGRSETTLSESIQDGPALLSCSIAASSLPNCHHELQYGAYTFARSANTLFHVGPGQAFSTAFELSTISSLHTRDPVLVIKLYETLLGTVPFLLL